MTNDFLNTVKILYDISMLVMNLQTLSTKNRYGGNFTSFFPIL